MCDSAAPARSDIQAAEFEVAAFADTDPAPRRPDGAPEVRCIPLSLQQPGPRQHSCEKSCSHSKVFSARRNVHNTWPTSKRPQTLTKAFPTSTLNSEPDRDEEVVKRFQRVHYWPY